MPPKRKPANTENTNGLHSLTATFNPSIAPQSGPTSNSSRPPSLPRKRGRPKRADSQKELVVPRTPSRRKKKEENEADEEGERDEPGIVRNADKSARRKSVRRVIEKVVNGGFSDDQEDEEDLLAHQIYSELGIDDEDDEDDDGEGAALEDIPEEEATATPSRKRRKKQEYIHPPLDGYESYFDQNRKGTRTSHNTLANLPPLDHSEYFRLLREHPLDHELERQNLLEIHRDQFGQWAFELSQGFNLLLYGYGSKHSLLMEFAKRIYSPKSPVIVVNGYVPTLTPKGIFSLIFTLILGSEHRQKLGSTPNEMLDNLINLLDGRFITSESSGTPGTLPFKSLNLLIHNIDGEPLRSERTQSLLSKLCSHPKIHLVASCNHIRAPLLWDSARVSQYNFLWHDCTTFLPYSIEAPIDDTLQIGRSGRAGGTKGVKYVLASLPANAKELYRILISHQLQAMVEDGDGIKRSGEQYGVEYKVLYHMAVEEFICSNDMSFRTLLKEFQDHQMVTSRKDIQGAETLWAPFRREELESILEDIISAS